MLSKTNEQFINELKEKYKDSFDYSLVNYKNNFTKIKLICTKHKNIIETYPKTILKSGKLCPLCEAENNFKKYIEKAKKVWNNFYTYDKFQFKTKKEKGVITCPLHGDFMQSLSVHLNGHGCPKCCKRNTPYTNEEFIEQANKVHNNKYDYSKIEYINERTPITIVCPIHGEFQQKPYAHLQGKGCFECKGSKRKTNKEFITEANLVHNFKYDYSLCNYENAHKKVLLICPEHGQFYIKPNFHLLGGRCPKCAAKENKFEVSVFDFIKEIYDGEIIRCDRKTLYDHTTKKCKEIDIFLPELNLGIECNGEYWHELHEQRKPGYHKNKQKLFQLYDIQLHNINFSDWVSNNEEEKLKLKDIIIKYDIKKFNVD